MDRKIKVGDLISREGESGIVIKHGVKKVSDVRTGHHDIIVVQVSCPAGLVWWTVAECNIITPKLQEEVM